MTAQSDDDTASSPPLLFVDADPTYGVTRADTSQDAPAGAQALALAYPLSVATHDTTASIARSVTPLLGRWQSETRHPIAEWASEQRRGKTTEQYTRVAKRFALWLARERGKLDPLLADHADLRDYLLSLREAGLKPSTQALHANALGALYSYLMRRDVLRANPMAGIHKPRADAEADLAIDVFTTEEFYALLGQIAQTRTGIRALRDRALFALLFRNGLRVSEAVGSDIGDLTSLQGERVLQLREHSAQDQHVKGGRARDVVLKASTAADLDAYLAARGLTAGGVIAGDAGAWRAWPLFAHTRGASATTKRLSRSQVWRLIQEYGLGAGIAPAKLHPHMARHTFASTLADAGVNVFKLKEATGHRTTRHLERYIQDADRIRNNAAKQIPY